MHARSIALAAVVVLAIVLGGCPPQSNDTGQPTNLSDAQKAVVNAVLEQCNAAFAALGPLNNLIDAQNFLQHDVNLPTDTCPKITVTRDGNGAAIVFDFGPPPGCSHPTTGGATISGKLAATLNGDTQTVAASFDQLSVNGRQLSGTAEISVTGDPQTGLAFAGTLNITTPDVGVVTGSVNYAVSPGFIISVDSAHWTLTSGGIVRAVTLAGLVLDPEANGNWVSKAGSAAFEIPNTLSYPPTVTVRVFFSSQSPVTGTVQVATGSSSPASYQLPGF